jgi:hypothetical protein
MMGLALFVAMQMVKSRKQARVEANLRLEPAYVEVAA